VIQQQRKLSSGLALILFCPLLYFVLLALDLDAFALNVEAQTIEDRDVLIGNPDQREESEQRPAPVVVDQAIVGDQQKKECYPVAEAVFAGEQIEELALHQMRSLLAASYAEIARFAEDFFVRDRPTYAGNRNCDQQQLDDLYA